MRTLICILVVLFASCDQIPGMPSSEPLTEAKVVAYVKAQKALQKLGPKIGDQFSNPTQVSFSNASAGFDKVDKAVKGAGFDGYADFVVTNAVIAKAFSDNQASSFMGKMDDMQAAGGKQIQDAIDDPDTPAEMKAELKKQLAEMKGSYAGNKKWANLAMDVTGSDIDPETAKVLKKHEKALLEIFTYGATKTK